jgi:hypothetical protein
VAANVNAAGSNPHTRRNMHASLKLQLLFNSVCLADYDPLAGGCQASRRSVETTHLA